MLKTILRKTLRQKKKNALDVQDKSFPQNEDSELTKPRKRQQRRNSIKKVNGIIISYETPQDQAVENVLNHCSPLETDINASDMVYSAGHKPIKSLESDIDDTLDTSTIKSATSTIPNETSEVKVEPQRRRRSSVKALSKYLAKRISSSITSQGSSSTSSSVKKPQELLWGTHTLEEHEAAVELLIHQIKDVKGEKGLRDVLGLEFHPEPCPQHASVIDELCNKCRTVLVHKESGERVTHPHSTRFIPKEVFNETARLFGNIVCDIAVAQDKVVEHGETGTLVVISGMNVPAGLFSRGRTVSEGLERGTALPFLREASERGWKVVLLGSDDQVDLAQSLDDLANQEEGSGGVYVLAHSRGGARFVRYLLDRESEGKSGFLSRLCAVAFTDSTHDIRIAKRYPKIYQFLQSPACVYFKCGRPGSSRFDFDYGVAKGDIIDDGAWAGDPAETDSFWRQRFGDIETLWAGTTVHSMVNWPARRFIWNHFDAQRD